MEDWKEAFWLTKFQLKRSISAILVLLIVFVALIMFITMRGFIETNTNDDFIGIDNFSFLLFIFILPNLVSISTRTVGVGNYQTTPYVIALNQLAISKLIIVKHRFISRLIISLALQIPLLIGLYFLSPSLQQAILLSTYLVFSLIWICLSIYVGSVVAVIGIGHRLIDLLLMIGGFFVIMLVIYFIEVAPSMVFTWDFNFPPKTDQPILSVDWGEARGIVNWTLLFAKQQPLLSSGISIFLAIIGWKFWMNKMLKKMNKLDYL